MNLFTNSFTLSFSDEVRPNIHVDAKSAAVVLTQQRQSRMNAGTGMRCVRYPAVNITTAIPATGSNTSLLKDFSFSPQFITE